ncbi:MAG: PQQ-binding-like beta-propeller repeat protein [Thermoleophilaceae bacterium]
MNRRRLLIAGAVTVVVLGAIAAIWAHNESEPTKKRGSSKEEFVAKEPRESRLPAVPWPMYAYDRQRTHIAPFDLHPPYRRVWQIDAHNTLEYPPSIGYRRVFVAQQKGLFFALDARGGHLLWRKDTHRCSASSPTIGKRVVYQAWMDFVNCPQDRPGASGYLIAWDVRTGRKLWKRKGAPIESSPLLVGHTLYYGSWDHKVHAVDSRTGRPRWSFQADDQVNTSPAYWRGGVYAATDGGSVYALSARSGRMRWHAQSNSKFGSREFFYATPTVAYGRVYIGNSDGTMYVYGARSGKLRWARPLGSYIYSAAAVWKRRIYVGTYDGSVYALDAATGDVRWKRSAPGAVHGAPTVMNGLVYFSTCSTCGSSAQRTVKRGPDVTFALKARSGRFAWRFPAGKYANPVVADGRRIYVTGRSALFALAPKKHRHRHRRRHGHRRSHRKR